MSAPLHLSQVLEQEYAALHGPLPPHAQSWLLRPEHLVDPAGLAARLADQSPVSRALQSKLPPTLPPQPEALVAAMNPLLQALEPLYDVRLLPEDAVDEELTALLAQHLTGEDLVHINRLLLETAYPGLIVSGRQARLTAIWQRMRTARPAALCLSGGGIRSATFALGVLQGLARAGLLGSFDYLSTVSGGGFIGSWLTAWNHRHPQGAGGVVTELAAPPKPGLTPEPRPVHRLREYSNYMSPRLGLLSADTWTLVGTYLRNLLLNWLVLVPLLAAALALPRLVVALYGPKPEAAPVRVVGVAFGWPEVLLGVGFLFAVVALAYIGYERPSHQSRRGHARKQGRGQGAFLAGCLLPFVAAAFLFTLYWHWRGKPTLSGWDWVGFALFGAVLHLAAYAVYGWRLGHGDKAGVVAIMVTGALGGLAAGVLAHVVLPPLEQWQHLYPILAVPLVLTAILLAATLFVGFASRRTTDEDREWWARSGAWLLIVMLGWSGLSALVIWGPEWIAGVKTWVASLGGVSAMVTVLLGSSTRTAGTTEAADAPKGLLAVVRDRAPLLAAPVLAACVAVFLSMGADWLLVGLDRLRAQLPAWAASAVPLPADATDHLGIIGASDGWLVLALVAVLVALSAVMSVFVNINKFSLHAMYRNRLIRAYLGASRNPRRPNLFTGFDRDDNVYLRDIVAGRPLHVVNMALNLVGGDKLAWQERKAETFTVTPLHSGSYHVGYRPSGEYGGPQGITLGTAAAISGAAASPNMGYHSSPMVTFLMALFNARLGWWLGNPGVCGAGTYRARSPRLAFLPMLEEALGLTNDRRPYVYLSDGGHFDNLGLVEMVLRRCHIVVVSDAGCDPKCAIDDLGAAIRKIRIDLGVPVAMGPMKIRPRGKPPGAYCAVGRILYSEVDGTPVADDGWLVYLKPAFKGDEPADVVAYASRSETFPQEPTSDQWFSESQFESYRQLGLWEIATIIGAGTLGSLDAFVARAEHHVRNAP